MTISAISRTFAAPGPGRGLFYLVAVFLLCPWFAGGSRAESGAGGVAVFVSQDIRPYLEAAQGISAVLAENAAARVELFSLDKITGKSRDLLRQRLDQENPALSIAIGPEAVRLVGETVAARGAPWLYGMTLNPVEVWPGAAVACGIPLDIPPARQLEMISLGLPGVRRLGLLYDPLFNSAFFEAAAAAADLLDLTIVPLAVSSKKEIPGILERHFDGLDALWLIPDRTVISESIVHYIIKEALFSDIPVIGYNRFFYESGAALSFVFDYGDLGRQAGRMALAVLAGRPCEKESPVFRVWRNPRVINKLGIGLPQRAVPLIEDGP